MRRLRENEGAPHHDVVAEQSGDTIDDARMRREIVRPPEIRMAAVEALERAAVRVDQLCVFALHRRELARAEHGNRERDAARVEVAGRHANPRAAKILSIASAASSMSSGPFGGLMKGNQTNSVLIASDRGQVPRP